MKNWKKTIVTAVFGALVLLTGCTTASGVSLEEARAIAYAHAGVSDARDRDAQWDDGRWEVSFESGGTEYEYHIGADGKIIHWEKETVD